MIKRLISSDLTESSFPKLMLDVGAVYLHGYDKEGYKICKSNLQFYLLIHSNAELKVIQGLG